MKMMLHCCCGPCSTYSLMHLRNIDLETVGYFYNPNIHPYAEFNARKSSFIDFSEKMGFNADVDNDYGLKFFINEVKDVCDDKNARCERCYRMRLLKTALSAKEKGCTSFSTTLSISPYQDHELIKKVGNEIAKETGVDFKYFDFSIGYKKSISLSKDLGLYRQKYCGCIFSEGERYLEK